MDVYLRRAAGNIGSSRKGSNLVGRDPKHEDKRTPHCNRIGCSTNLNYMKGGHLSNANKSNCLRPSFRSACSKALANMVDIEKPKCSKATFRSTCNKVLAGSSSASLPTSSVLNKSNCEQKRRLSSKSTSVTDSSSASSRQDIQDLDFIDAQEQTQEETENGTTTSMTGDFQSLLHGADSLDSTQGCSTSAIRRLTNGNSISMSRSCRQKPGNVNQDTSSSTKSSVASRSGTSKHVLQTPGAGSQRYGLKSLGCASISDVLPTGWSSSNVGQGRMVESVRKRPSEGESSSGRGKGIVESSSEGRFSSQHSKLSGPSVSTPEHLIAQEGLRNNSKSSSRGGGLSVRTRRGPVRDTRMRLSERVDKSTPHLDPLVIPQPRVYIQEDVPESPSRSFLSESPLSHDSFGSQGSSNRLTRNRLLTNSDDRGGRHFNMEMTAEVLLALERIEHIEDLTFELMMLEMNLYLGGLSFQDQHRDMRMDIDNMSYEDLLALEEKIGTVSTALSEEALSKCLKRSIYIRPTLASAVTACGDDIKCSICQEDYASGDDVGSLACEHRYHVACIHQWLRLKNWCPICKSSAVTSS